VGACVSTNFKPPPKDDYVGWSLIKQPQTSPNLQEWKLSEELIDPSNPYEPVDEYAFHGLKFDAKLVSGGDSTLEITKDPKKVAIIKSQFVISITNLEGGVSQQFYLSNFDKCHFKLNGKREWDELSSIDVYHY
jgi:hypothetical protein